MDMELVYIYLNKFVEFLICVRREEGISLKYNNTYCS